MEKRQNPFMTKIEGNFLNLIKDIYVKPKDNIMLKDERLSAFPLRTGIRQGCSLLTLLVTIVLEVIASSIKQEK